MTKYPKDPAMLLSYINTQLRDHYSSMDELCKAMDLDRAEIDEKLAILDYEYDPKSNRYV